MGLLDRFRNTPKAPAGRYAPLPEHGFLRVVGESDCQSALQQMRGRRVPGAEDRPSFSVALVSEPENPYDEHTVAVISEAGRVRYLPREDARRFGPTLRALQRAGYDGGAYRALLNGGRRDKPSFGITPCIARPEDCEHRSFSARLSPNHGRLPTEERFGSYVAERSREVGLSLSKSRKFGSLCSHLRQSGLIQYDLDPR